MQRETLGRLTEANVTAPPGSIVLSVVVAPAATVSAGDPIIEWIDCSTLLVDVPVSDAEMPLIEHGSPAEIVLEGEPRVRAATGAAHPGLLGDPRRQLISPP